MTAESVPPAESRPEQEAQSAETSETAATETAPAPTEPSVKELQEQLAAARSEVDAMRDRWQRSAADFSNYRRRQQFEQEEAAKYAVAPLLTDLLLTVDNFERAFAALPGELIQLTWIQGIEQIAQLVMQTLQRHGVRPIDAQNQPFDPRYHEAVMHEEGEGAHTVLQVFQRGYTLHERVLRPALVKVGPPPDEQERPAADQDAPAAVDPDTDTAGDAGETAPTTD